MKRVQLILVAVLTAAMGFGLINTAHALPCSSGYVKGDGADYECLNGAYGDQKDSPEELNNADYFGYDDWALLQKVETPGAIETTDFDVGLQISYDSGAEFISGEWEFTNTPWNNYTDILIVLKDGKLKLPEDDLWYSVYYVDEGDVEGYWNTGGREVSYITIYGRGTPIPEPATMMLLGTGLVGVGVFRKKFKA